jgi:hypothetical protein
VVATWIREQEADVVGETRPLNFPWLLPLPLLVHLLPAWNEVGSHHHHVGL